MSTYASIKNDTNIASYESSVKEVLEAPDFQFKVTQGSRYRLVGEVNAFNFTIDDKQIVYICITTIKYPERLVFPMLKELSPKFQEACGDKIAAATPNQLSKKCEPIFLKLVKEYDDASKKDKLSSVMSKVEDVKLSMHNNIDGMLRNLDQTERVEKTTAKLHEQARLFDSQARTIKRQEQWKNMKLTLMIGGIAVLILILLVIAIN